MTGCALSTPALVARLEEWRALLRTALIEETAVDGGVRLRFRRESAVEATLGALVAKEAACCAGVAFRTTTGAGDLTLDITGAADTVSAIRRAFGASQPRLTGCRGIC